MFYKIKLNRIKYQYFLILLFFLLPAIFYNFGFFKGLIIWGQDTPKISFPLSYLLDQSFKNLKLTFWTPDIFFGYPIGSEQGQYGLFYFPNIIHIFFKLPISLGILYVVHQTFAGFFTFLFTRERKMSIFAGIIAGIAYEFNGFIVAHAQYPSHIYAFMYLPLIFYLLEKAKKSKNISYFFLIGSLLGIQFLTGHPNIPTMTIFASTLYLLFLFKDDFKKLLQRLLIIFFTAFIVLLPLIFEMKQLIPLSTRAIGVNFMDATNSSMNFFDLITFIFPNFFFSNLTNNSWAYADTWHLYEYWGQIETFGYIGIVTLFLSIFSLSKQNIKKIYPFLIITFVSFIIALGRNTPIYEYIIFKIPLINGLRAPGRFVFLIDFCLVILAGYGLGRIVFKKINISKIKYLLVLLFPLFIGNLVIYSKYLVNKPNSVIYNLFSLYPTHDLNISKYLKYSLNYHTNTSLIILVITAFVFLLTLFNKMKRTGVVLIVILLLTDLFLFSQKINTWQTPSDITTPTDPDIQKLSQNLSYDCCRVYVFRNFWSNLMADRLIPYHIPDANGFVSLELNRNNKWQTIAESQWQSGNPKFFQLGSIKYVYEYKNNESVLTEIKNYLPRAYIAYNWIFTNNASDSAYNISLANFNPNTEVVVEGKLDITARKYIPIQPVKIIKYESDYVQIKADANEDGLLVLTDTNYPNWKVYVNGKEQNIFQTNYLFRGVPILKGENIVEFKYDKSHIVILLVFSYLIFLASIFILVKTNYDKEQN